MSVKLTMNSNWDKVVKGDFTKVGLLEMVTDIHRRSVVLAPRDTSALVNSSKISSIQGGYKLSFGGSRVPYARIQHEGGTIKPKRAKVLSWEGKDGKRHFAKSVTIKGTKYLEKAADSVARGDKGKYFRGKV